VLILPGIVGGAWVLGGVMRGLRRAGIDRAIDVFAWGRRPLGWWRNLTDLRSNQDQARRLADRLADASARRRGPGVVMVGFSGGSGFALLVADALPEGAALDRLILVSAAVSPSYDLKRALARSRRGVVSFYSRLDGFMLGGATTVFGTVDRRHGVSAGFVGFQDGQGRLRADPRLTQIGWRPSWMKFGHLGGHVGYLSRGWAQYVLAPQIDPAVVRAEGA